jgi:hypothetical protein
MAIRKIASDVDLIMIRSSAKFGPPTLTHGEEFLAAGILTDTSSCAIGRRRWERAQSGYADRSPPAQAKIDERRASEGAPEHEREGG